MRAIGIAIVMLLQFATPTVVGAADAPPPAADETGMVPGDIVLGNIANFPGHAGIYVGKWNALPEYLRHGYAHVYEDALIRSRDLGLKHTFLVIDSDGGRGVRLTSFAEQFTGFLPKGQKRPTLAGALTWEAQTGMAIEWPGLGLNDPRRWKILEEALAAASARVPYDDGHAQWQTVGGETPYVSYWTGRVEEARATPYTAMSGLDCIAFVHVVYWRGAGEDLDVSWAPWHTPEQLYAYARDNHLARAVLLEPVWREAGIAGMWNVSLHAVTSGETDHAQIWLDLEGARPYVRLVDPSSGQPLGDRAPLSVDVTRSPNDTLVVEERLELQYAIIEIAEYGVMSGYLEMINDEGPYRLGVSGEKQVGVELKP